MAENTPTPKTVEIIYGENSVTARYEPPFKLVDPFRLMPKHFAVLGIEGNSPAISKLTISDRQNGRKQPKMAAAALVSAARSVNRDYRQLEQTKEPETSEITEAPTVQQALPEEEIEQQRIMRLGRFSKEAGKRGVAAMFEPPVAKAKLQAVAEAHFTDMKVVSDEGGLVRTALLGDETLMQNKDALLFGAEEVAEGINYQLQIARAA